MAALACQGVSTSRRWAARVGDRLREHLPGSKDPVRGADRVSVRQFKSIASAKKAEARSIKTRKPPQNKRGK